MVALRRSKKKATVWMRLRQKKVAYDKISLEFLEHNGGGRDPTPHFGRAQQQANTNAPPSFRRLQ